MSEWKRNSLPICSDLLSGFEVLFGAFMFLFGLSNPHTGTVAGLEAEAPKLSQIKTKKPKASGTDGPEFHFESADAPGFRKSGYRLCF